MVSHTYLGVDVDRNLSYQDAVHNAYVKANRKLFTLRKIRPCITQRGSALIHKQFILPLLDSADFLVDIILKNVSGVYINYPILSDGFFLI